MKKIILSAIFMATTGVYAQVGIGTENPQGSFNIDGAKDNATTGVPTLAQQANDFVLTPSGSVGVGTTVPNINSILDLVSSDKGVLLPRVALESTDVASPLTAHVEGMLVFNTHISDSNAIGYNSNTAVQSGYYYNDGSQWALLITKQNQASSRSGDIDLNGDRIFNGSSVGSASFNIYDNNLHPYFNGDIPDALTVLEREGNKTFVTDGTGSRLFTITNAEFDVNGTPDYTNMGNVGIGTISPSEKLTLSNYAVPTDLGLFSGVATLPAPTDYILGRIKLGSSKNWFASINSVLPQTSIGTDLIDLQLATGNASNDNTQIPRLTVKAISGNVGIGTTNPDRILSVAQAGNGTPFISNTSPNLMRFESTANSSSIGHHFKSKNAVGTAKETVMGINPNYNTNNGVFFIGLGTGDDLLGFDLVTYNSYVSTITGSKFGIGTKYPVTKLEVSGAATNTTSITETTTTIDFATSNLAGTSASAGAFILNNLKDGGAYTLAVKGATSGTCSFTANKIGGGTLTVHLPVTHGPTTASKHTLYNFVVIGNDVYVSWMKGL